MAPFPWSEKARKARMAMIHRLIAKVPHGHWQTTTLIGALGVDGVRCSTVVDSPVNADVFAAFVEQVLAPERDRAARS